MGTFRDRWQKFRRGKAYRDEFVAAQVKQSIPYQIRALMEAQGLTQQELADHAGVTQGVISRAANPNYGNLSVNTCVRIAAGFGVGLIVKFVSFSELDRWADNFHDEAQVASFTDEDERAESLFATFDQVEHVDQHAVDQRVKALFELEQQQLQRQAKHAPLIQQWIDFDGQADPATPVNLSRDEQKGYHYERQADPWQQRNKYADAAA